MCVCFFGNRFYSKEVRASEILSGEIDAGTQCQELYAMLLDHDSMFERVLDAKSKVAAAHGSNKVSNQQFP